jgi:predicted DCC family thiol-disulfide oxidoreductase YuxK
MFTGAGIETRFVSANQQDLSPDELADALGEVGHRVYMFREMDQRPQTEERVVVFDGVCNLCGFAVNFILDHERDTSLRFVAIQSDAAHALLERVLGPTETSRLVRGATGSGDPDSIVFVDGGHGFTHSDAALQIARYLRAPYRWLNVLRFVPRSLRDGVYRWIARNRYRWFGKNPTCRVPTPETRARFLS